MDGYLKQQDRNIQKGIKVAKKWSKLDWLKRSI